MHEIESCSGRTYGRLVTLLRSMLNRPQAANAWYQHAQQVRILGHKMHNWTSDNGGWHIPSMYVSGLRSKNYWDDLPIKARVEAAYPTIKAEFQNYINSDLVKKTQAFTQDDYSLVGAGDWTEHFIYSQGNWNGHGCSLMPQTCDLLRRIPELAGTQPPTRTKYWKKDWDTKYNMMGIYKMEPGTVLKPHTGETNIHVYCHLGLVVPEGPWLKVGGEMRQWEEGKVMCFDDSYIHEAWHNGTETRYVMIMVIWHPDLGQPDMPPRNQYPIPSKFMVPYKKGPESPGPAWSTAGYEYTRAMYKKS